MCSTKTSMDTKISDKTVIRTTSSSVAMVNDQTVIKTKTRKLPGNDSGLANANNETGLKTVVKKLQISDNNISKLDLAENSQTPKEFPSELDGNQPLRSLQNRFKLQKVLGVGGMGVVYKAIDLRKVEAKDRNPYIAIKVLNDDFKKHPDALIALQREARKSQSIAHPNIVNVYDFDRDDDVVFMTMEYLEGLPLDKLIKKYQFIGLPLNEAWGVFKGICEALIYAHQENIIHSDFKPGNIFVNNKGVAKVFDFGISRAVKNTDIKHDGDKTVFDAGTLGALTPAYASLEMLNGQSPDERDDIYALACVTYEIFSGEHPFNKLPADKAFAKKLRPKRISELSSAQWAALKKALSFKRQERTATVEQFMTAMTAIDSSLKKVMLSSLFALSLALTGGFYIYGQSPTNTNEPSVSADVITGLKSDVTDLIETPNLVSIQWNEDIWSAFKALWKIVPETDEWSYRQESRLLGLYAAEIQRLINSGQADNADILLSEASKYTDHDSRLPALKVAVQDLRRALHDKEIAEIERLRAEEKRQFEQQKNNFRTSMLREQKINEEEKYRNYNLALNQVSKQLLCRNGLNTRLFGKSLRQLETIDSVRYKAQQNSFIDSTISCINKISADDRSSAEKLKSYAIQLFPGVTKLATLEIGYVDLCKRSYAGMGGKNPRATCQDALTVGESGPKMVVVRAPNGKDYYAIGKYEVSNREFDLYCKQAEKCKLTYSEPDWPVVNLSINDISGYILWLNEVSHQNYKLPTHQQWLNAAVADSSFVDPNRNCSMNSRGVIKGESLVNVSLGKQNDWGLVNMVGNASEIVLKGVNNKLFLAGGSKNDKFSNCNINTVVSPLSIQSETAGFRLVRDIL